jgi:type IV pilus assembly protein PilA
MRQENSKPAIISANGCGCLVLLMCIGVMTAIAHPSFFGMATKARQSEGKQYISSMNKGQQAYYAENNALTNSVDGLGLGLKTETTNYKYSIRATKTASIHYALAKINNIKSYFGGVFVIPAKKINSKADNRDAITTVIILCETDDRPLFRFKPADEAAEPIYQNGKVICGKGTTELTR